MKKINVIGIFLIVKGFVQDEFQFYSNFHPTAESESKYWQYNKEVKYSPSKVYNPIKSDMTYNYVISKPMVAVIAIIYIDIYMNARQRIVLNIDQLYGLYLYSIDILVIIPTPS